jgi:hypothetical protein
MSIGATITATVTTYEDVYFLVQLNKLRCSHDATTKAGSHMMNLRHCYFQVASATLSLHYAISTQDRQDCRGTTGEALAKFVIGYHLQL